MLREEILPSIIIIIIIKINKVSIDDRLIFTALSSFFNSQQCRRPIDLG